ncbi:hypothetical protein PRUPE_7G139000 [Prunus persica]|uniref:NB-ARC domain-containing protein n=1 Tax=Prunus persica TaxID=3760 RepID=M5VTY1_PRUPE|nr:hypothetical protein PRUPE_7G139000 [Prunus persica]
MPNVDTFDELVDLFAVQRRRFVFFDDVVLFNNDGYLASWFMREKMTVDSTTIEKPNTRRSASFVISFALRSLASPTVINLSTLPEKIGKLVSLEVLRLRSCTDLLELPGSIRNLKKLKFLDISYCFSIKELPEHIETEILWESFLSLLENIHIKVVKEDINLN